MMQRIENYTPEQEIERSRLIALLKKEERYYRTAVQPFIKALADIEAQHNPRYVFIPEHFKQQTLKNTRSP